MKNNALSFSKILSDSWSQVQASTSTVLIGVLFFFALTLIIQVIASAPMTSLQMENGVPVVAQSSSALAIVIVVGLLALLIGLMSHLFFLLVATKKNTPLTSLLTQSAILLPTYIALNLLIVAKSFVWVGALSLLIGGEGNIWVALRGLLLLAGFVAAVIRIPRFALAPALWLTEAKGVTAAVKRSFDLTNGYWPKIMGNVLLLWLIFTVISIAIMFVLQMIGNPLSPWSAARLGNALISQAFVGFFWIFMAKLTATIAANPQKKSA